MRIQYQGEVMNVSGLRELGAANAHHLREQVGAAIQPQLRTVEIDLSEADYVDGCGLGTLVTLYKKSQNGHGAVAFRLLRPRPAVQQLIELTRLHRLFEVVPQALPEARDQHGNPSRR